MVQYKRKPVHYLPPPTGIQDNSEVWVIRETGEVFMDYESYLHRLKKFTCDVTGHTNLSFFDALTSEKLGSKAVDTIFPDSLREPVLRKVQFSTISRMDDLVNTIFDEFKNDFFPGERVVAKLENGERIEGVVKMTTRFNARPSLDGSIGHPPWSRLLVRLADQDEDVHFDNNQLTRDRKIFSKQILRSFLKNAAYKEPWTGAPWIVKEKLALEYKLDMVIPLHLQYDARMAEKKAIAAQKKTEHESILFMNQHLGNPRNIEAKPQGRGQKMKLLPNALNGQLEETYAQFQHMLPRFAQPPFVTNPGPQPMVTGPMNGHFQQYPVFQPIAVRQAPLKQPPPPPPIKYPIDDLDVGHRRHGELRPQLKFMTKDNPAQNTSKPQFGSELQMQSVGPLLEIWNTLNVHVEVYILDSFTFDDLVEAMQLSSESIECELFVEIHCAVLKQLVDREGDIQVPLQDIPDEEDLEEDESDEESEESSPTPEPERPPARTTRSSLAKSEAAALKQRSPSVDENQPVHRAAEMLRDYGWIDRLKARDFANGGWQVIIVGLLRQLSLIPKQTEICEKILAHLAPPDEEPTQQTARQQYVTLDANLRIAALEMIVMLSVRTKALRKYLEECSKAMTEIRKKKSDCQTSKRPLIEELKALDEQRKMLLPDPPVSPNPDEQQAQAAPVDVSMTEVDEEVAKDDDEDATEDEGPVRSLRRGNDRANERKRKRDEEIARKERERKEKAEKPKTKQSAQLKKVLRDIEKKKEAIKKCESDIAEFDEDLRQTNCQRTKVLGRDRFWNRYYWFERNGMPYAGIPTSSTSNYGYANGRLWVQGPDELERQGFLDLPEQDLQHYRQNFGMSILERKEAEEGPTSLRDAGQWGYYDNPEDVEKLIAWLDERGKREKDLRKELQQWREPMMTYMGKMKEHLEEIEEKREEGEEQATRVSTRTKTYIDIDASKYQCLAWHNSYAVDEFGHLHSEQPKPRRGVVKKKGVADNKAAKVPVGKSGKPLTRQGTRYG
ncbi:hypothetical protein M501DRAFT_1007053 [Patellaria atrata CBS 101060]|uniref:WAC domain-containing protein n=1 Tax=Patellaria atrata CBS 101060 TaxID=1346257 RepID=A0A9P4VMJ7_9PEZI|nr:hypothetical protein M501DRAFT_1007053 [Patellaria atrata CBS 101060]